jgi:hypothetical protein
VHGNSFKKEEGRKAVYFKTEAIFFQFHLPIWFGFWGSAKLHSPYQKAPHYTHIILTNQKRGQEGPVSGAIGDYIYNI